MLVAKFINQNLVYLNIMTKIFLFFFLSFLPFFGNADTLDYWSVYQNDSLIAQYNSSYSEKEISISRKNSSERDTLFIVYGNDHPCTKCEYYYAIKDTNGVKILVQRSKNILEKITFPLLPIKQYLGSNEFVVFVYEDNYLKDENTYIELFTLKLE